MRTYKTKQNKRNKGSIVTKNGKIYARLRFTDDFGKKRDVWRTATNVKHAQALIKSLIEEEEAENRTSQELDAARMTFSQLTDFYEKTYLHEPIYLNDRKISGLRRARQYASLFKQLRAELVQYKIKRLNTPTHHNKPRGIADVNHALQMLRRLLSIAVREGWLTKSPFQKGDSLISLADAPHRTRILSFEEEKRLLATIDAHPSRKHLKGITLIALDMAFRANEIRKLKKGDIDFTSRTITIRAFNSKTARSRTVA
jgi:integrase